MSVASKVAASIGGEGDLQLSWMRAICQILDAESATLPSTGRGDRYDVCQYLENLLGKESPVTVHMRQRLSAN